MSKTTLTDDDWHTLLAEVGVVNFRPLTDLTLEEGQLTTSLTPNHLLRLIQLWHLLLLQPMTLITTDNNVTESCNLLLTIFGRGGLQSIPTLSRSEVSGSKNEKN